MGNATEDGLRTGVQTLLAAVSDCTGLRVGSCATLPFGYLFELDASRTIWLMVSAPCNTRATEWMTADWFRLVMFFRKHRYYAGRFESELAGLHLIIKRIEEGVGDAFKPDQAALLLERSLDEVGLMVTNLRTAESGFANALADTLAVGTLPGERAEPAFLFRILGQLRLGGDAAKKQLEKLRDRWPQVLRGTRLASPRVQGDFFWSVAEEATVARYIDCNCSTVIKILDEIRRSTGRGFGPNTDRKAVAQDIYEWLRKKRQIIYEHEPVHPNRHAQRIRKHAETISDGTCIDLSCLYAALLEGASQRPLLVLNEGHMTCGLWLDDATGFPNTAHVCKDALVLRTMVAEGKILLIECMGFSKGTMTVVLSIDTSFADAVAKGAARIESHPSNPPIAYALDVKCCRKMDIQAIRQNGTS